MIEHTKTLHLRLKHKNNKLLDRWSQEVNFVWNYVNQLTYNSWKKHKKWLSEFDVNSYVNGITKQSKNSILDKEDLLDIGSATVQEIVRQHATRRRQHKRSKLKWRTKDKLNWIPFRESQIRLTKDNQLKFNKKLFKVWDSYGLDQYELRSGTFSQDNLGNWYVSICVKFEPQKVDSNKQGSIGIDLGLKDLACYSDGSKFSNERWYRKSEDKLKLAQRANKKKQTKNIHKKIKNKRKDALHKEARRLVNKYSKIAIGNVNSSKLAKKNLSKSIYDAGWFMFKTMLEYKSRWTSTQFKIVNEAYTTQTCSNCGSISGPKGLAGLGIRHWECSDCGVSHDRDTNAARNILQVGFGHETPVEGIPAL